MIILWLALLSAPGIALAEGPFSHPDKSLATRETEYFTQTRSVHIYQSALEIVADNAATGDGGNSWGGHQTRIVRTVDGVFTAYTDEGGGYFSREWRLAWRQEDGTWPVVAQGIAGREPVNLLASPDGTLYVVGWPSGIGTVWTGKPDNGTLQMTASTVPGVASGYWPYNSAGIDSAGNLCILSSSGEKPGYLDIACYRPAEGDWSTRSIEIDYRHCYTYVFPQPGGALSLVSTRDVLWETLGYEKPPGAFDYVFNAFRYWRTTNFTSEPLQELTFVEQPPTPAYPDPYLNAQMDAFLDAEGKMHILYWCRGASTGGSTQYRHRAVSQNGGLEYDVELPPGAGYFNRIFQDARGEFYILSSSGYVYPVGQDGASVGSAIALNLEGYEVEYSGFGVSVPRTGTPTSNVIDVVFPSDGGTKWIYFQLHVVPYLLYVPIISK